jgi:catechol 2,3-dioxygenase-like lactoylglutathione lyase family enzyme
MIKTVWSVTFYVSDLEKAARFYEETLGLEKKYAYSSYVGFECGGVEIGLIPKAEKKASVASSSVGFLVDDVEKAYNELKKKGVKFTRKLHDEAWGGRQASFEDIDGNVLEIVQLDWEKYFNISAKGASKKP